MLSFFPPAPPIAEFTDREVLLKEREFEPTDKTATFVGTAHHGHCQIDLNVQVEEGDRPYTRACSVVRAWAIGCGYGDVPFLLRPSGLPF